MGFLLVDVYLVEWRGRVTKTAWWDLPGLLAWASIPFVIGLGKAAAPLLPGVVFLAYLAAFRGRYLAGFFRSRFVTAVGGMCYTIYLYHSQMIWWVKRWFEEQVFGDVVIGRTGPALAKLAVVSLAIVAICAALFVLFEKPFMRRDWHRRWFGRTAPAKPSAAVDAAG